MVRDQSLDLGAVRFFVLDEADRLVDQDGLDMVMQLYNALPKGGAGTARLQVRMACSVSSFLCWPCSCPAVRDQVPNGHIVGTVRLQMRSCLPV